MMNSIQEGKLCFTFPPKVSASKYDDWAFYRNQFLNRCYRDNKAVDILCVHNDHSWLIEVKDFRVSPRTKAIDLPDEIALKVRDTLAGLMAAKFMANDDAEREFAQSVLTAKRIRVVCHVEQGRASRLRPRAAIDNSSLQQKLRGLLKAIDPHPIVMDSTNQVKQIVWDVCKT